MKKARKTMILLTAVMMMLCLFGCSSNKQFDMETYKDAQKNTLLLDYFDRTVGVPEEQPYHELALYTYSQSQALLEEYTEGGTDDETVTRYLVPVEAAQEMLDVVKDSGMAKWNLQEGIAIDGMRYVCKFPDGSGGYIRVSSENMPEDGVRIFGKVLAAMRKWAMEAYLTHN